jgi:hypothetical protein
MYLHFGNQFLYSVFRVEAGLFGDIFRDHLYLKFMNDMLTSVFMSDCIMQSCVFILMEKLGKAWHTNVPLFRMTLHSL